MNRVSSALVGVVVVGMVATCSESEKTYCVSGDAIPFNTRSRLADATISVLEFPDMSMVTGDDGHFKFCGFGDGDEVTLVLDHPDYHAIQTGTQTIDGADIEQVTFQVVDNDTYQFLAMVIGITPDDETRCQMVTTVTRVGKSLYDEGAHGEAGATVTVEPVPDAEMGPIYFNESVMPDPTMTETSEDGGVLFVNVEPGEYVWTAHEEGVDFTQVKMKCRAGYLVNASPPKGLQAL